MRDIEIYREYGEDHYHAMAADDEMIFTVPKRKLADLMAGLRYVRNYFLKMAAESTKRKWLQQVSVNEYNVPVGAAISRFPDDLWMSLPGSGSLSGKGHNENY